ncbi:MAG: hypothetical protein PHV62_07920 [Sulfuricurvum sp.]|nr:hypothetical protein [Sulfuricurvum sp.]
MTDYPDLSQPAAQATSSSQFPDLSQPVAPSQSQGFWGGLYDKYQNFMNPNKTDQFGNPMVETFLGRMPDMRIPENQQAQRQQMMQSLSPEAMQKSAGIMTMMMAPEIKLASMLPAAAAKYLPATGTIARTAGDALSNIFKTGAGVYGGSKMMGADEQAAQKAGVTGAEIATGITPLALMAGSLNPWVRMMSGAGLGYLGGSGMNQLANNALPDTLAQGGGAVIGALLGGRGAGMNQLAMQKTLGSATPDQLAAMNSRLGAANSLGIDMNMLEGMGTPVAQRQLESLGTTPSSAGMMAQRSQQRLPQEQAAIGGLLNDISPAGAKTSIEGPIYDIAKQAQIPGMQLNQIYQDPYLKTQIDGILGNPLYSDKLANVSPTSIEFLDLVKRRLNKMQYDTNIPNADKALIGQKTAKLTDLLNRASPKLDPESAIAAQLKQQGLNYPAGTPLYEIARDVSEKRQARDSIVSSINQAEMNGSNFYNTWLEDDKKFNQLRYQLRSRENPDITTPAQQKLDAMRESFPYLIDPMGQKVAQQLGAEKLNLPSSITSGIGQMFNNLLLNRYNKALSDLIWKPNWDAEIAQLSKMKSGEDRGVALGRLLSRISSTGSAVYNQQGSTPYATGQ